MKKQSIILIISVLFLLVSSYLFANAVKIDKNGSMMNVLEIDGKIQTASYPSTENEAFSNLGYLFLIVGAILQIWGIYLSEKN